MLVHEVFAQISEGIVRNITVCDDSYVADFLTKATYGEDAFAVQCNQYGCRIGDVYRDGMFYHVDETTGEEKPVYYSPTAEEEVAILKELLMPVATLARMQAVTLNDEEASAVPELYPDWYFMPEGQALHDGKDGIHPVDRLRYKGIFYKVIASHEKQAGWAPDVAPSLFAKLLIVDPEAIPEWELPDSTNGFSKGDVVRHRGKFWESLVDNNVWEPGMIGSESLWKEVTMNGNSSI